MATQTHDVWHLHIAQIRKIFAHEAGKWPNCSMYLRMLMLEFYTFDPLYDADDTREEFTESLEQFVSYYLLDDGSVHLDLNEKMVYLPTINKRENLYADDLSTWILEQLTGVCIKCTAYELARQKIPLRHFTSFHDGLLWMQQFKDEGEMPHLGYAYLKDRNISIEVNEWV